MNAPFSLISDTSVGLTTTKRPLFSADDTEPNRRINSFFKTPLHSFDKMIFTKSNLI